MISHTFRYFIYAILLVFSSQVHAKEASSSSDIKRFLGCWNSADNQNWEYGFFEKFAIYHCDFWEYESIQSGKNKADVVLRKGDERIKLKFLFNAKTDSICTIIAPKKGKRRMIRHSIQPDYTTEDHSKFTDNGYRMDSVTIVGYLRNTQRTIPFEVSVYNIMSNDRESFYADIDSLGCFRMTVPVVNTTFCSLDWQDEGLLIPGVIEPKDTLFLYYDYDRQDTRFMGNNARLLHEIRSYNQYPPHRDTKNHLRYDTKMEHDVYLSEHKGIYKNASECFDNYLTLHPRVSDKMRQFTRMNALTELAISLIERRFVLRHNFNQEFLSPAYMEYVDQLYQRLPSSLTLFYTTIFLINYLGYYNDMDACPVASSHIEAIKYLNKEKIYPLSQQQLDDLNAYDQASAIDIMGNHAKADSLLIDSMAQPFKEGTLRTHKLLSDTILQRLIKDCTPIIPALMELKYINDEFYCFNHLRLSPIIKEWMIAQTFYQKLYDGKKALSDRSIEYFNSLVSNEYFKQTVLEIQENYQNLEKQDILYSASLKKTDHLKESKDAHKLLKELIDPYKGKIIYLDVWGTWCGPCKREMTYAPAIKEAMSGKDVIFMYLASSSPEEGWKNVIKENKLTGPNVVHYNLPTEQQGLLERLLSINSFPTYIMIDREGNIVDMNSPSPSQKQLLLERLNKLLAK